MRRSLAGVLLPVLGMLLEGCITVGNPSAAHDRIPSEIQPRRTTTHDVLRLLGEPTHSPRHPRNPQGRPRILEVWTYDYTHVDISPSSLIPLVGPFVGTSPVTTGSTVIRFDADGIAQHVTEGRRFDPHAGEDARVLDLPFR